MVKKNKGHSKKKKRQIEANIRELIGENYSDFEIQEKLHLQPHVLRHYKKKIYDRDKITFQNMTAESVLADYAEKAQQCIDQLEDLIQQERQSKPHVTCLCSGGETSASTGKPSHQTCTGNGYVAKTGKKDGTCKHALSET